MARISPKSRKLLIIGLFSIIAVFSIAFFVIKSFKVEAQTPDQETIPTSVVVGNSPPTFTSGPAEATASTNTSPTSIGTTITFNATATEPNGESYYFIVCSTNSVVASTTGAAPTCATGATTYCKGTISAQASGVPATCTYDTVSGNAWKNEWYAFVCDNNTNSACSMSQGSGGTGSPFYVNHPPSFDSISRSPASINPGGSITWTATASDSDVDENTSLNGTKLFVCKTQGITINGSNVSCDGGEWCHTSLTTGSPSCGSGTLDAPMEAKTYNAYVYILDYFNLEASGGAQGTNSSFVVNNVAPTIANITLNGANTDITLTESTTKAVPITATVTDNNGCSTLSSVKAYLYRSGIGYSGGANPCNASGASNGNHCYPEITCSTSNCTGTTATYSCTANMQYFADPTDTGSIFASENWLTTIKATDSGSLVTNTAISAGKDVRKLIAFNITPKTLEYGGVPAGTSIPLTKALKTQATGNVGINQTHHADSTKNYMCTDFPTCSSAPGTTRIPITNQQYSMVYNTPYDSGTALSTTPTTVLLKIKKPTSPSVPQEKSVYWGIKVDSGTKVGTYQGQNIITAETSATADW